MTETPHGALYLVPVSLGSSALDDTLPSGAAIIARGLQHFVVENAKTARAELKRLEHPTPLRDIDIHPLPRDVTTTVATSLLAPALAGKDMGLMSEAGVPAVADPGALLVREAHRLKIRVVPLVGPSSLLLALMASGLDGQRFAFHGYLPIDDNARRTTIQSLEAASRNANQTQLFIETPYRNMRMLDALLCTCQPDTLLCVARALTTPDEWIHTCSIARWRRAPRPRLDKIPTVFLLLGVR